jgi:TIR domain
MSEGAQKVFISYRREETSAYAGRLYDAMAAQLGEHNVFMDVELAPGVDFVERITDAVGGCHVLLVIIGPQWATLSNGEAAPRIAQPDDFVRLEVETALRRDDVTVIPVLVGGARMPDPGDLPDSVRALARRNALELGDMRWRTDIQRLVDRLNELLAGTTGMHQLPAQEPAQEAPPRTHSGAYVVFTAALVALVAGVVAYLVSEAIAGNPTGQGDATPFIQTIAKGAVQLAVVGAALAIWLSYLRGDPADEIARLALVGLIVGGLGGALGGAVWGARLLPDHKLAQANINALGVGSDVVAGGVLGALIGGLWIPRRVTIGLGVGIAVGALFRWAEIYNFSPEARDGRVAAGVAKSIVITCIVLGVLLVLDFAARPRPTRHAPLVRG